MKKVEVIVSYFQKIIFYWIEISKNLLYVQDGY